MFIAPTTEVCAELGAVLMEHILIKKDPSNECSTVVEVYPSSVKVKEELQEDLNEEELKYEVEPAISGMEQERSKQSTGGSCGISLEEFVHQELLVDDELEVCTERSTHFTSCDTRTQGLSSHKNNSFCVRHNYSRRGKESHIDGLQSPTYVCESCGEVFPSNVSLIKHTRMSEADQAISADNEENSDCSDDDENILVEDAKVYFPEQIKKRDGEVHSHKGAYKCDTCGKSFSELSNLKRHTLIHSGKRPYKCDICGKSFSLLKYLKRHSTIHSEQRPYKCDICGKSFSELSIHKRHALIHSGKRPYECDICGKSFSELSYLKRHALIHSGNRPYKCDICGKSFSRLGHLRRHGLIHSGKRPYECHICSKSFNQMSTLKRHSLLYCGNRPHS